MREHPRCARGRRAFAAACVLVALGVSPDASAERTGVPFDIQVKLLGKVARYDKNLRERAAGTVRILVIVDGHDAASKGAGVKLQRELAALDKIDDLPVEAKLAEYEGAEAVARLVREQHLSIVYVAPGLDGEAAKISAGLTGVDVLSVAAVDTYVSDRIVLGFELVSGKPKLVVHLAQAKSQNVAFSSAVLKLMKVRD